jgi:hypothetical protein
MFKKKRARELEPLPEEVEREIESDLVAPVEKALPPKARAAFEKRFVLPLKKRHLLGIAAIAIVSALLALAIISIDVAAPGAINPFKSNATPEPEAPPVVPVTPPVTPPAPPTPPPEPPSYYFPSCEQMYGSVKDYSANEATKTGSCFRDRQQPNACIEWALKNARKNEVNSYEFALAYYSAAQRCAVDLEDRKLSADIETYLTVYKECWRLPNDSNYNLMATCFANYKRGMGALWVDSVGFDAIAEAHADAAQAELDAYYAKMVAQAQ